MARVRNNRATVGYWLGRPQKYHTIAPGMNEDVPDEALEKFANPGDEKTPPGPWIEYFQKGQFELLDEQGRVCPPPETTADQVREARKERKREIMRKTTEVRARRTREKAEEQEALKAFRAEREERKKAAPTLNMGDAEAVAYVMECGDFEELERIFDLDDRDAVKEACDSRGESLLEESAKLGDARDRAVVLADSGPETTESAEDDKEPEASTEDAEGAETTEE